MRVSDEQVFRVSQVSMGDDTYGISPAITASLMGSTFATASVRPTGGTMEGQDVNQLDVHRVADSLGDVPDVREDIVASLRARIEAGTYTVTGEQIAEMLVRRFYADQVR